MMIDSLYINNFSNEVTNTPPGELKEILLAGRGMRVESAQKTHFWDLEQKKLHRAFDSIYALGIQRLAETTPSKLPLLVDRISPRFPAGGKEAVQAAKIGLGGYAGWLVGWGYGKSQSNLILHEYSHAWAAKKIYPETDPKVSVNALHWLKERNWYNWFWGIRQDAPGNWTSYAGGPLSEFGKSLTPLERNLYITSAGLGSELILTSAVAGLGLLAIKRKHRVLGASLLGFSVISLSGAHSYIRRYPELLVSPDGVAKGDPGEIATGLSSLWDISKSEAFRILWYGYLFVPILLFTCLAILLVKPLQDIPDECVLMRLLTQEDKSFELRKILLEVELDMASECKQMEELSTENQEKLTLKACDALIKKIKANPETRALFKKIRKEIAKEIKGSNHLGGLKFKLQEIAAIVAFTAYQIRNLELANIFPKLIYYLSGLFLIAQSICTLYDCIQTVRDLANEKFSALAKGISIARAALSIATLIVIAPTLYAPVVATYTVPFLIAAAVARLALAGIQYLEMRRISAQQAKRELERQQPSPAILEAV